MRSDLARSRELHHTRRMLAVALACASLLCALSSTASASPILYSFTGIGDDGKDLAGFFTLDDATEFVIDPAQSGPNVTWAELHGPNQSLWGTYGEYLFSGSTYLEIVDTVMRPFPDDGGQDIWALRVPVASGPTMGGQAPVQFNLVTSDGINRRDGLFLDPLPSTISNPGSNFFALTLSNGQDLFGHINTLTRVPEPATITLLAIGVGGVLLRRRAHSRSKRAGKTKDK